MKITIIQNGQYKFFNPFVSSVQVENASRWGDASPVDHIPVDVLDMQVALTCKEGQRAPWNESQLEVFDELHAAVCNSHAKFVADTDFVAQLKHHIECVAISDALDPRVANYLCLLHRTGAQPLFDHVMGKLVQTPRGVQTHDEGCSPLRVLCKWKFHGHTLLRLICEYHDNVTPSADNIDNINCMIDTVVPVVQGMAIVQIASDLHYLFKILQRIWDVVNKSGPFGEFKHNVARFTSVMDDRGVVLDDADSYLDVIHSLVVPEEFLVSDPYTDSTLALLLGVMLDRLRRVDTTARICRTMLQRMGRGTMVTVIAFASLVISMITFSRLSECVTYITATAARETSEPFSTDVLVLLFKCARIKRAPTLKEKRSAAADLAYPGMPVSFSTKELTPFVEKVAYNTAIHEPSCIVCMETFNSASELSATKTCKCAISVHHACVLSWAKKTPGCMICKTCFLPSIGEYL